MRAAAHDAHPCASPDGRLSAVQIGYPADLSLNADVTVPAWDRAGLERLLRYCARPIFASERLQWIKKDQQLVYRLPKARPNGQTVLHLTPLEFLDKLAVLIPPPRKHRHRYHGVLAPNAPLRQAVTAYAGLPLGDEAVSADQAPVADEDLPKAESKTPSYTASLWAMLIARIYEALDEIHPCISHYVQLSAAQIRSGRICPLVCPQRMFLL